MLLSANTWEVFRANVLINLRFGVEEVIIALSNKLSATTAIIDYTSDIFIQSPDGNVCKSHTNL